ncbi:MAG: DUF4097 family beta strand repeat-containing protein [Ruminococcus sp.]
MNKIVKTLLITSGICGGTGVLLLTVGVLMGARGSRFWDALSIQIKDGWERGIFREEVGKSAEEETDGDSEQWNTTVHSDVRELDIDLGAREIYLEEYEGDDIQVLVEADDKKVTVEQKGKELQIGMRTAMLQNDQNQRIVKVLIPQEYEFDEVDISVGAGECVMENLNAKIIDMETGAGSILGEGRIQAKESSWDVSAGSIVLQELQSEDTEIDCTAGSFEATFAGAKEEYYLEGDVGAGSFEVGGSSWDTLGKNISLGDKRAIKKIFSDCAAGSITIDFTKS